MIANIQKLIKRERKAQIFLLHCINLVNEGIK